MHKMRPLVKPMVCVAPNGQIIDVIGPFPATQNDASVIMSILKNMPEVKSKFESGDIFVVDRGFRDAISYLEGEGFMVKMPEIIPTGENQLSDLSANRSRMVTKIRYVVEVVNGHLKTCFRYFDRVWQTPALPHLMQDLRNAAAIHNKFYAKIISDVADIQEISELMLAKINQKNILGEIVKESNLNRRLRIFRSITDEELPDFPILTERDLYLIALGRYQINQAKSYYGEHVTDDGRFRIEVSTDVDAIDFASHGIVVVDPLFIKGRIQSKHVNKTKYYVYVLVEKSIEGKDSIQAYYCTCKNGARTVGCCAHVTTIIWYLGYARHLSEPIKPPSENIEEIFITFDTSDDEPTQN